MPNTNSAKKRLRQDQVRNERNRSRRSVMRGLIRKVREAVAAGDLETAETGFREAAKQLDRAGAHNLIHKNTAARTKSRLQKLIRTAKQAKS